MASVVAPLPAFQPNDNGLRATSSSHIRNRSLSTSSSTSSQTSLESWGASASTSSSSLSLDAEPIKSIFATLDNVNITYNGLAADFPCAIPLSFDKTLSGSPKRPKRALTVDLNPTALPFVPTGIITPNSNLCSSPEPSFDEQQTARPDNGYEVISTHSPYTVDEEYIRPPGLPDPLDAGVPTAPVSHPSPPLSSSQPLYDSSQAFPTPHPSEYEAFGVDTTTQQAPPPPPGWYASFVSGTHPGISSQIREFHAHAVVSSLPQEAWASPDDMGFFATQFASHAYMATENASMSIAEFAASMLVAFEAVHGPMCAQSFLWSLRRHSLQAFMSSWEPAALDPKANHPSDLAQHVISAIALARFLGDLFILELVTRSHITACIAKVFEGPFSEEHVVALAYLVLRSGPRLWLSASNHNELDIEGLAGFISHMEEVAEDVRYSLVNTSSHGYCMGWVEEVRKDISKWGVRLS